MKSESLFTKTPIIVLIAMISCVLWGSAPACIKVGYELFDISSGEIGQQLLFAGMRFAIAGVMVIILDCIKKRRFVHPKASSFKNVLFLCLLQTVFQYVFYYTGLANTIGVHASVMVGSNAFIGILLVCFVFRTEKMTARKLIGSILGFAGVIIVTTVGFTGGDSVYLLGDILVLLSAASSAMSSIFIKKYSSKEDPVTLSGYQFLLGGVILMIIGFVIGGRIDKFTLPGILLLLYMAFVSAAAYTLWAILLKHNPVSRVLVFSFMNPVFGVIISAIVLGESENLGFHLIISLIMVCVGIFVVNRGASTNPDKPPTGQ